MSDWVEEGEQAPDFTLVADDGKKVKLSAQKRSRRGPLFLSERRHARMHERSVPPFVIANRNSSRRGRTFSASVPTRLKATVSFATSSA